VAGNTTPTDSSGDQGGDGGIANLNITPLTGVPDSGVLTLTLSQVTGNTAGQGGGIFAVPGSPITLKLTLIARNTPDNCAPPGSVAGCKN
jgi:hypothetical protein